MNSSKFMLGYEHRPTDMDYNTIFHEFKDGTGPEKSLMSGSENGGMIKDIMRSHQYSLAYDAFGKNGTTEKFRFAGEFGVGGRNYGWSEHDRTNDRQG